MRITLEQFFNQFEINSLDATPNKILKFMKASQQTKYERRFGKVIPNGRTNLEINPEEFCSKERFKQEFAKENFNDFKGKKDLSVDDAVKVFLAKCLEIYDDNGWLISKVDNYEDTKDAEMEDLIF